MVRIGKPLGKIADVGQWIEDKLSPSNSCGLTPCGGSIKVSVLNSMVVDFEEPDGGVCITAPVIDSLNTKTCSNMTNDQIVYQNTSNTSHAICGTKGETLICTRQDTNCIVNNETTRIKLQTFDGSIFISLPEYNQTERKYFNVRRTIDGQDCIFLLRTTARSIMNVHRCILNNLVSQCLYIIKTTIKNLLSNIPIVFYACYRVCYVA